MYRNISYYLDEHRKGKIRLDTWDSDGNPVTEIHDHDSEIYYESNSGTYNSMYGTKLKRLEFDSIIAKAQWKKHNKETKRIFNDLTPIREFLVNKYEGQQETAEFTQFQLRKWFLDIEIATTGDGFPESYLAEQPINVITIFDTYLEEYHIWYTLDPKHHSDQRDKVLTGTHEYETFTKFKKDKYSDEWNIFAPKTFKTHYHPAPNEKSLILDFIRFTEGNFPDVVSGWNIDGFDTPYICNRIINLFDERTLRRLSPLQSVKTSEVFDMISNRMVTKFDIEGITFLDYCFLYKNKFNIMEKRPNYRLDTIAYTHLGAGKLEYDGSIHEFWRRDIAQYIEYNRIDVERVYQLDLVLNYINLARTVCNFGLVEYNCIYKSAPYIYGALTVQARSEDSLLLSSSPSSLNSNASDYTGAFVKEAQAGLYTKGIASYDLNSLYPSIIRTLNISPETKVGKVIDNDDPNEIIFQYETGNMEYFTAKEFEAFEARYIRAANGVYYLQHDELHGILPKWCARLYQFRSDTRKIIGDRKSQILEIQKAIGEGVSKEKEAELINEIAVLSNLIEIGESLQLAVKLCINTAYGVIGSEYFQLFDVENAEAITLSGQVIIQSAGGFVNQFMRHRYKDSPTFKKDFMLVETGVTQCDQIVYGDTDSILPNTLIETNKGSHPIEQLWERYAS